MDITLSLLSIISSFEIDSFAVLSSNMFMRLQPKLNASETVLFVLNCLILSVCVLFHQLVKISHLAKNTYTVVTMLIKWKEMKA